MRNGLEKRLSRLEKRVAERTERPSFCICRVSTRFHNAECLDAVLKGTPRVCPVHGFRELGTFWWTPEQYGLRREDNQFCPCRPHSWRSFVLSTGPRTWEGSYAAQEASLKDQPDAGFSFEERHRRSEAVMEGYWAARQQWVEKAGRQPPSRQEIVKLGRERVPKFVGR